MKVGIVLYLSISIALLTAYSLHAEALHATVSEGLAQGPYMAARAVFEPTALRPKGVVSTNAPPRHLAPHSLLAKMAGESWQ